VVSYEDRPEKDTPQWIQDELRAYGGESPGGDPIWKLVLAENCRTRFFGTMNHVSQGAIDSISGEATPLADGKFAADSGGKVVPDRIEHGEHWVPRFGVKGWILLHWYPASAWGSRAEWEGQKDKDGRTRLLAAFPQRGDYMVMSCGPWRTLNEVPDVKALIRHYNFQQIANPVNWENDTKAMIAMEKAEREAQAEQLAQELEAQYRIGVTSVLTSVSSAAQRVRNAVSQSVGGVQLDAAARWGS
jgi:hypothetical protein